MRNFTRFNLYERTSLKICKNNSDVKVKKIHICKN